MSKKVSITLLTLVAFFVLGFSLTANAAKPVQEKDQVITSAPLIGQGHTCILTNVSGRGLNVTFEIIAFGHDAVSETKAIPIGGYGGTLNAYQNDADYAYCRLSWFGLIDDFEASFCGHPGWYPFPPPSACLKVE